MSTSAIRSTRPTIITGNPPPDGIPLHDLAKMINVPKDTLRSWVRWETHPALGRRIRSGIGTYVVEVSDGRKRQWNGVVVSRKDAEECADAKREPCYHRFPGNPGVWTEVGIFHHDDGRDFYTAQYVYAKKKRFNIPNNSLCNPWFLRKLETLSVVWPASGSTKRPWGITVYSGTSLDDLAIRLTGRTLDGGRWVKPGCIWKDGDGTTWWSSKHIAEQAEKPARRMHEILRASGMVKNFKEVPTGRSGQTETGKKWGGNQLTGRPHVVHLASEIIPLLGIDASPATALTTPPTKTSGEPDGLAEIERQIVDALKAAAPELMNSDQIGKKTPGRYVGSTVRKFLAGLRKKGLIVKRGKLFTVP